MYTNIDVYGYSSRSLDMVTCCSSRFLPIASRSFPALASQATSIELYISVYMCIHIYI